MKRKRQNTDGMRRYLLLMLSLVLLLGACMPLPGYAAGKIDTGKMCRLEISYLYDGEPVAGAEFDIYKVATIDAYAGMSLTAPFSGYGITFDDIDQAGWQLMAETLKGNVQRDDIEPDTSAVIGSKGTVSTELSVGVYLVVGNRFTNADELTFTCEPFMVVLPGLDNENNSWVYSSEVHPKCAVCTTARRVLKIWDDEGFESIRPEEITVDLLCDGEIYDTVILNDDNNWRYDWGELEYGHEWTITEREPDGYAVYTDRNGVTFTLRNKFVAPVTNGITVLKRLSGTPEKEATFTFILKAEDPSWPMPDGSRNGVKSG